MRTLKAVLFLLLAAAPLTTPAEVSPGNVPAAAVWYFHADFEAMRSGEAGRRLYTWLDAEVFEEVRDESGVDLGKETTHITAYAEPDHGIVIVIDGDISQESEDKMLAMGMLSGDMDLLGHQRSQRLGFQLETRRDAQIDHDHAGPLTGDVVADGHQHIHRLIDGQLGAVIADIDAQRSIRTVGHQLPGQVVDRHRLVEE